MAQGRDDGCHPPSLRRSAARRHRDRGGGGPSLAAAAAAHGARPRQRLCPRRRARGLDPDRHRPLLPPRRRPVGDDPDGPPAGPPRPPAHRHAPSPRPCRHGGLVPGPRRPAPHDPHGLALCPHAYPRCPGTAHAAGAPVPAARGPAARGACARAAERPFNFADVVHPLPPGFDRLEEGQTLRMGGRDWTLRLARATRPTMPPSGRATSSSAGTSFSPASRPTSGSMPPNPRRTPCRTGWKAARALPPSPPTASLSCQATSCPSPACPSVWPRWPPTMPRRWSALPPS